jgi:hypothetical protein
MNGFRPPPSAFILRVQGAHMKQATDHSPAYHAFARALVAVAARVAREQQARAMLQSGASQPSPAKEKAV